MYSLEANKSLIEHRLESQIIGNLALHGALGALNASRRRSCDPPSECRGSVLLRETTSVVAGPSDAMSIRPQ